MKHVRRLAAAIVALVFTLVTVSPVSAAPLIDFGPALPPFTPTYDISFPPEAVGELGCSSGIVFGNFTDLDQDDDTLRVYGITANDVPVVEYPAVRAWGTFIVVVPGHRNLINLVAYDEDGNRTAHRGAYMLSNGTCTD